MKRLLCWMSPMLIVLVALLLLSGCPKRPGEAETQVVQVPPALPAESAPAVATEPAPTLDESPNLPPDPPQVRPQPPPDPEPAAKPQPRPATPTPQQPKQAPAAANAPAAGPKPAAEPAREPPAAKSDTVVVGTIETVSNVPDPSTVPYDTCVTFITYRVTTVISGEYEGDTLLAVFWGMRKGELQPAARFSGGQSHQLTVEPFANRKDLQRVMQADDTGEYSLTPYWVIAYTSG